MWELDYKESWALKNWCFWTAVLDKTLESPLDCKEIQPVNPKENQSWIFIGRTDADAETPILWPAHEKNWLIRKDPDAKDWRQEKGMAEDEIVGWHDWLDGNEFEQAPGVGDGQGSLACCSLWSRKESDMTKRPYWKPKINLAKCYCLLNNIICYFVSFCTFEIFIGQYSNNCNFFLLLCFSITYTREFHSNVVWQPISTLCVPISRDYQQ